MLKQAAAEYLLPSSGFRVQLSINLRRAADCMDHFVSRLDVTKLRLKQQGLGVEFLSNGGLGLRREGLASF